MKSKEKKLILISFALAIMAAGAVFIYLHSLKTPKDVVKTTVVPVAAGNIPPRTLIEKKMIKEIKVPESSLLDGYIKNSSEIEGKFTKEAISQNEGFYPEKLMGEKDNTGELSLKIDGNHRAVSVNVTGDSGVSDLLKPGDYVDIIVYLSEKRDGEKIIRPDMAEVILQNIEVLAIDKQLNRDSTSGNDDKMPVNFLVAVSVPVQDIGKLVLAEDIGSIKLALRPANNNVTSNIREITEADLLAESGLQAKGVTQNNKSKISDKADYTKPAAVNTNNIMAVKGKTKFKYYKIKYKDTLKKVSRMYYGNSDDYVLILKANNIKDENHIVVGETVKVPIINGMR